LDDSFAVLGRFAIPVKFSVPSSSVCGEIAIVDGEKLWFCCLRKQNWTLMARWYHVEILEFHLSVIIKDSNYTSWVLLHIETQSLTAGSASTSVPAQQI
jgi:hypothetical protein